MFFEEGLDLWYPDANLWVLVRRPDEHEIIMTEQQMISSFGLDRVVRIKNGLDREFYAYHKS